MALQKLSDRISYLPPQLDRERPMLAHIRGDRYCLAVDAGYSAKHVAEFYAALDGAGLPRPSFTALTHWHCDHSFGLHAADGVSIACSRSNARLREHALKSRSPGYRDYMVSRDEYFALEYPEDEPVTVVPACLEFESTLRLDLGGVTAELFLTESPHGPDSVCIFVPEERVLFLGDAIYGDPDRGWSFDAERIRALIAAIEATDCDIAVPAHARPHGRDSILRHLRRRLGE